MPIESPVLDDLSYEALQQLLIRKIPTVAPEWTDHNASDPGITLIQLFGYLAEQIGYRLNRVPDKNYIEFLKLLGIVLSPAEAAATRISFLLAKPETTTGFLLRQGAAVKASTGDDPPSFEIDANLDVVPAQLAAIVTTRSADLRQITPATESAPSASDTAETYVPQRFSLAWDGKRPKLKDMPGQPVAILARATEATHKHLWLGLAFNPAVTAGFIGQRVTMTVQLDDDEKPLATSQVECGAGVTELVNATNPDSPLATYRTYRSPRAGETTGSWVTLPVLSDTTEGWTRSGEIRFDVPRSIGPVPDAEWQDARGEYKKTTVDICKEASGTGSVPPEPIAHPLIGAIKNPVTGTPSLVPISGWIEVQFTAQVPTFSLRAVAFNVASATHAETVRSEVLGRGDGRPGQTFQTLNDNVLASTLALDIEDATDGLLHQWRQVASFDAAGPRDRVYVLDAEAGILLFGDGLRGRPPEDNMRVVASVYRHGGGALGSLDAGAVDKPDSLPSSISDAINIVAARGGKDAETLEEAKARAPAQLRTRERAVTAEDFELIASGAAGVDVARVVVVPLKVPYAKSSPLAPGLDLTTRAPGAVSLVIVPEQLGLHPSPTEGELRTVCRHLDKYRLITTEVHLVPPMYVRLFDISVVVRASPGLSRTLVRERIATQLEKSFHVLTGGPDGEGFDFGATVHHADLMAQVFRTNGVDRVEEVVAYYDSWSEVREGVARQSWRPERSVPRRLTACAEQATDSQEIVLAADETVFVDTSTLTVVVR